MCGERKLLRSVVIIQLRGVFTVYIILNNSKKYNPKTKEEWSAKEKGSNEGGKS